MTQRDYDRAGSQAQAQGAAVPREPEIQNAMKRLLDLTNGLAERTNILESRFTGVLRPTGPTTPGNPNGKGQDIGTPLGTFIMDRTGQLLGTLKRLEDICERCELPVG